jgi:hypothetical protein
MAKKELTVPKGKDVVSLAVSGHKYVRIIDAAGNEAFRSDAPGEAVSAILPPGNYTIDTDGKIGKADVGALDSKRGEAASYDGTKAPKG